MGSWIQNFLLSCCHRGKIPLFITEKLQSCIHWLIQSSHSIITLLSTKVHSYFSLLLPPLRRSMILCSKGKPSHWVLLKRLLFHNIHCLLGNWDTSKTTSHHHNSIQNHGFCSSRRNENYIPLAWGCETPLERDPSLQTLINSWTNLWIGGLILHNNNFYN